MTNLKNVLKYKCRSLSNVEQTKLLMVIFYCWGGGGVTMYVGTTRWLYTWSAWEGTIYGRREGEGIIHGNLWYYFCKEMAGMGFACLTL